MREINHETRAVKSPAGGAVPVLLGALLVLLSPIASVPVVAESGLAAQGAETPNSGGPADERIEPAPGGGDMILLSPGRGYIARVRTDEGGSVSVECDHPNPNRETNDEEQ